MEKIKVRAPMVRKVSNEKEWRKEVDEYNIQDSTIIIEKTIEVDTDDFDSLASNFFKYRIIIRDNLKHMWSDDEGRHSIAVTCKGRKTVICIESSGYDYARYVAIIDSEIFKKIGEKNGKADSKI